MFLLVIILSLTGSDVSCPKDDHGLYISVIEMIVGKERTDLKIKVFKNDLADAIANAEGIDPNKSDEDLNNALRIEKYFNSHLTISSSGKNRPLHYVRQDNEGDASFLYFSSDAGSGSQYTIMSNHLMELFPSQQNVLQLSSGDTKLYYIFKKGKESFNFTLPR